MLKRQAATNTLGAAVWILYPGAGLGVADPLQTLVCSNGQPLQAGYEDSDIAMVCDGSAEPLVHSDVQ